MTAATPAQITLAFSASSVWTASLLAHFFAHCRDPLRAARGYLRRRRKEGLIDSAVVDAYPTPELDRPLHVHRPGRPEPDFGKLAYELEKRWNVASQPIKVYFATPNFARLHGSWTGCKHVPEPNKCGHNLLVSRVWLLYLKQRPDVALNCWTSERFLQFQYRRGHHSGPIPDGLINTKHKTVAVEVGGLYNAATIRRHAERFNKAKWHWVLW